MFKLTVTLTILTISLLVDSKIVFRASSTTTPVATTRLPEREHVLTVVTVADGDTITVRNHTSRRETRVRFLCIDAPEKSQEKWGNISLTRLRQLLPVNSTVRLIGSALDLYNRTLAEVVNMNGTITNLKMMEEGLVAFYPFQRGCPNYRAAEAKAKQAKLGVWSDKSFENPWDYRKRMGIGFRGGANRNASNSTTIRVTTVRTTVPKIDVTMLPTTLRHSDRLREKNSLTTAMSFRDALLKSE